MIYALSEREARLITTEGAGATDGWVEVAHEALIQGWTELRHWVDADRAGLRIQRRLAESAGEWATASSEDKEGYLYKGTPLAVAREWAAAHRDELNPVESDFLTESEQTDKRRKEAEIEIAQQREADARRIAAETRKKLRASRIALASVVTSVAFCSIAAWFFMREQSTRSKNLTDARLALDDARRLKTEAQASKDLSSWDVAVQASTDAVRRARSAGNSQFLRQVEAEFDEIQGHRRTALANARKVQKGR